MKSLVPLSRITFLAIAIFSCNFLQAQCWQQVAGSDNFTMAVKTDGTLWGWGENNRGQLGTNVLAGYPVPRQTGSGNDWLQVSTGYDFTTAIKADGTLWAWGHNGNGQLGDATNIGIYNYPRQVGSSNNWQEVRSAFGYSIALRTDGTLWGWGLNLYGVMGNGSSGSATNLYIPTRIGADNDWVKFDVSPRAVIALKSNGTIWTWGWNSTGALGNGSTAHSFVPAQMGADADWAGVAIGSEHALAVKTNGTLWSWGTNNFGQLGDGTTVNHYTAQQVGTDTDWATVDAGAGHSFAMKANGILWGWGSNGAGQLGISGPVNVTAPQQTGTVNNWTKIQAGSGNTSFGIKSDGSLWSWGYNYSGQLGTGAPGNTSIPDDIGCPQIVVPVTLVELKGRNTGRFNMIYWKTATEMNSRLFEIEVSNDAAHFTKVGEQAAAGFSNSIKNYSFKHYSSFHISFYRLRMVDIDGSAKYSPIVIINNNSKQSFNIYPNPATDVLNIQRYNNQDFDLVSITDLAGKKILEQRGTLTSLQVGAVAQGVYIIRFYNKGVMLYQDKLIRQ